MFPSVSGLFNLQKDRKFHRINWNKFQKKICRFQFRSATWREKTRCTGHKHSYSHSENLQIVMTWSQTTLRIAEEVQTSETSSASTILSITCSPAVKRWKNLHVQTQRWFGEISERRSLWIEWYRMYIWWRSIYHDMSYYWWKKSWKSWCGEHQQVVQNLFHWQYVILLSCLFACLFAGGLWSSLLCLVQWRFALCSSSCSVGGNMLHAWWNMQTCIFI